MREKLAHRNLKDRQSGMMCPRAHPWTQDSLYGRSPQTNAVMTIAYAAPISACGSDYTDNTHLGSQECSTTSMHATSALRHIFWGRDHVIVQPVGPAGIRADVEEGVWRLMLQPQSGFAGIYRHWEQSCLTCFLRENTIEKDLEYLD